MSSLSLVSNPGAERAIGLVAVGAAPFLVWGGLALRRMAGPVAITAGWVAWGVVILVLLGAQPGLGVVAALATLATFPWPWSRWGRIQAQAQETRLPWPRWYRITVAIWLVLAVLVWLTTAAERRRHEGATHAEAPSAAVVPVVPSVPPQVVPAVPASPPRN